MIRFETLARAALEESAATPHADDCPWWGLQPWAHGAGREPDRGLCNCHVGRARLVLSCFVGPTPGLQHFHAPTSDELKAEFGGNWVIARRTKRILRQYSADVVTLTPKRYAEGERRALAKRCRAMGVEPFGELAQS